jgi:hypothetical protein
MARSVQRLRHEQINPADRLRFPAGERDLHLLHSFQTDSGTHSSSYPRTFYLGEKRPEHEADTHLHPVSRLRMSGDMPPYVFMACC